MTFSSKLVAQGGTDRSVTQIASQSMPPSCTVKYRVRCAQGGNSEHALRIPFHVVIGVQTPDVSAATSRFTGSLTSRMPQGVDARP